MTKQRTLSVRTLAEYAYRSGSIDTRFRTATTMQEGTRLHQKIQRTYEEHDEREAFVSISYPYEQLMFQIEGRCDGILRRGDAVIIDEIKSTIRSLDELDEDTHPAYWAQAKTYAYLYAHKVGLDTIVVQLTYIHSETNEIRQFQKTHTIHELQSFFHDLIERYAPIALVLDEHVDQRNASIEELEFPFQTYRPGQRKLAGAVYKTVKEGKTLFANAPTGIGKTISTMFPSIKALGRGEVDHFYYLTAKTTTKQVAEDTLNRLSTNGLHLSSVTVTAKDKICFKEKTICNKDYCEFADGYYDRLNDGLLDLLSNETLATREVVEAYARKHQLCPFEFSLDVSSYMDGMICDYNYVYDPRIAIKRTSSGTKQSSVLLVDEAHNLVDRGRSMFSASISKSAFLQVKRAYKTKNPVLYQASMEIDRYLLEMKKEWKALEKVQSSEKEDKLLEWLTYFGDVAEEQLLHEGGDGDEELLDCYFDVQNVLRIAKLYDERFILLMDTYKSEVVLKWLCLDPSKLLAKTNETYKSVIYYSATLAPFSYYFDLLGGHAEDYTLNVPSPFTREQTEVEIVPISTRYRDRDASIQPIIEQLYQDCKRWGKNQLAFFPSYAYMRAVLESFSSHYPDVPILEQVSGMGDEEREQFLARFEANPKETLLGFAVLGGVFSEGVDLVGDRLSAVHIIGVGLPQLSVERGIMKEFYEGQGKNGFDYAYVFPGMTRVLQAAGRLIRSDDDYGKITLLDDRFTTTKYRSLLPSEWL
ncbi:DNA helicase [Pontibacillus halophilus JSM 076056 = DSM 19796]|uniref:DNA helicase n=1 Tax=Pontibacillus halophilus JSM 076056 = DSM 19796 TaxID=1385510 RepID=A0A0A5ID38_9BACI|nr:ATP-dependent DNA helicase [Pontibacillus halophilus]KGX93757.1 DNA helicase [Pontibacillus halophilus JSM 076056 = DSM 19796]